MQPLPGDPGFSVKKHKPFYGWVIVAAGVFILVTLFGIRNSFGVFFVSIQEEFALSRTATSSIYSAYLLLCCIFGIISGWALDRYGPRLTVTLMGFFTGLSLLLSSQTGQWWQLFFSYSLLLALGTGAPLPMLITVVSRWFVKRRGLAIGMTTAGAGLGIFVVAPSAAFLISRSGWRISFIVIGAAAWVLVISLAALLRRDPRAIGLMPDGAQMPPGAVSAGPLSSGEAPQQVRLLLRQLSGTGAFWLMFAAWLLFGICLSLIVTHLVPYAIDAGITTLKASTLLSLLSGSQIASQVLIGSISDAVGRKAPGISCALVGAFALIWLTSAHTLPMFYLFAVLFGFAWGGISTLNMTMVSDAFSGRNLGLIMGLMSVGWSVGNAIGSALGGVVFDIAGSYSPAFTGAAGAMLVIVLLFGLFRQDAIALSE